MQLVLINFTTDRCEDCSYIYGKHLKRILLNMS